MFKAFNAAIVGRKALIALIRFSDFLGQNELENHLIEEIDQFVESARLVVLSDKTVERQIDGVGLSHIDASLWIDRYFKPRISRIRSAAAEAENVIGYFANSGHLLPRHDWISYNLSEMPVMRSTQKVFGWSIQPVYRACLSDGFIE